MNAKCPLCNAETRDLLSNKLRRGEGSVFHCAPCDLGFLRERERPADYYDGDYREFATPTITEPEQIFATYRNYQRDRLKCVLPRLKWESRILEIGASAGQFLFHLEKRCGARYAIELDTACCEFMGGMGIAADSRPYAESEYSGTNFRGTFDVVCAFQVMEHVADPVAFLKDVRGALRPGGRAFIEVPNLHDPLRSVWALPEYEQFYFHSDHLFYFSETALRSVASMAGFHRDSIGIEFHQDYNLANHLHWIAAKGPQPDCHAGLGQIRMPGSSHIADWIAGQLASLDHEYRARLAREGKTANIMLTLDAPL